MNEVKKRSRTENRIQLSEDALAEAIVRAHRGLESYRSERARGRRPWLSWFSRILIHEIIRVSRLEWDLASGLEDPPDRAAASGPRGALDTLARDPRSNLDRELEGERFYRKLWRKARSRAQRDYVRGLFLSCQGWSWEQAQTVLRRRGDADAFRRSALRWVRKVLPAEAPQPLPPAGAV